MQRKMLALAVVLALIGGCAPESGSPPRAQAQEKTPDVVYVGTPYDVVARMLKLAGVKKGDIVYDLGCGDGRMVVLAAQRYGCRGFGYDIDPERVAASKENARRSGVSHLVTIVQADLFTLDFSKADVLSLYLLPEINDQLVPNFQKLKPGSRLVLHDYGLEDFEPDESFRITSLEDGASHTLFLFTIPLKPAKPAKDPVVAGRSTPGAGLPVIGFPSRFFRAAAH